MMEHFSGRHSNREDRLPPDFSDFLPEFLSSGAILGLGAEQILIGWGRPQQTIQPQPGSLAIFAPDFFLTAREPWFVFPNSSAIKRSDLLARLQDSKGPANSGEIPTPQWQPLGFSGFVDQFQKLQAKIENGELQKGVPYQMAKGVARTDAAFRHHLLTGALRASSTLHPYGMWNENSGMLGLTPEILFTMDASPSDPARVLSTMALAGTQSATEDVAEFVQDPKLLKEHEIVAINIVKRLKPFGTVTCSPREVLELPGLRHLLTKIQLTINPEVSADFDILAKALHPTPALGADPIENGWSWLREINEQTPRHRFGAPFGCQWELNGALQCRCLVAIRNVQWQNANLEIGVGCGVVRESQLDLEWHELQLKLQTVRRLLNL